MKVRYIIQDKETGTFIDSFDDEEEAQAKLEEFEKTDKYEVVRKVVE